MKRLIIAFVLVFITILGFNCQKELSYDLPGSSNNGEAPVTATLQGNVVDENGQPATGATVKVGSKTAITNARGYFRITGADLDRNAGHVTVEKPGYFKGHRSFKATVGVNQVFIKLVPKALAGTINAGSGGEVSLSNGARVGLPANAVTAGQAPYSGTINVYAAYIDPTSQDISATVPGSFMADDKDGKRVTLASYGMMAVELETAAGAPLQIAAGKTATLTTPIPAANLSSAPSTISLWYVDESKGIWKEEGSATRNGNNYIGEVKHFSFWNCDIGIPAVTLSVTLRTAHGSPIVYANVRITRTGANSWIQAHGYTDSLGRVSGLVPSNENLVLDVLDPCMNPIYTQNIPPLTQNTDLGVITVNNAGSSLVTVQGRILNCNGTPVSSGYAILNFNNMVRYATANASGEFAVSFVTCATTGPECEVIGVDLSSQQQGNPVIVAMTPTVTNTGDLAACGVSSTSVINYSLNGTNYTLSTAVPDSVMAFTFQQGSIPFQTMIAGFEMTGNNLVELRFTSSAQVPGVYPVTRLYIHDFQRIGTISPFNVTITNFPTAPGSFYEGSFSGQFRDSANLTPLHTISGTFRIRR